MYVLENSFETAAGTVTFPEGRNYPESNTVLFQFQNGVNEAIWPEVRTSAEPDITELALLA